MSIVAMVPARSGSKGLPGKNLRILAGKPLIGYSLEAARQCSQIDEVFLNSDSQEYLAVGSEYGATEYLRRAELASDDCSMRDVVTDFAESLTGQGMCVSAIVVLYPTYPTRTADDIGQFVNYFINSGGRRSIIGFKCPSTHPYMTYSLDADGTPSPILSFDINRYYRRQDYPEFWEFSTWACVLPFDSLRSLNAQLMNAETLGYRIPTTCDTTDVDTLSDLKTAEEILMSESAKQQS
jgi:CMP-N,N'-diacetyllegionaminic acid synthase